MVNNDIFYLCQIIIGWINLGMLRVPGVLQRFGISYFIVASTAMIFKASSTPRPFVSIYSQAILFHFIILNLIKSDNCVKILIWHFMNFQNDWRRHIIDLISVWQRWIVAAIFIVVHTVIIFCLPVPGCPTGMHQIY